VRLGSDAVEFLKKEARDSPRRRARICTHRTDADTLHEMLIAIAADSYIPPHKHVAKAESFHVIEGTVDVVMLDDAGRVTDVVELGCLSTGRSFYYRLRESRYHTLLIRSAFLVVHEVTTGPFMREHTQLAPFAPAEDSTASALLYLSELSEATRLFKEAAGR
jgi:cupin fold WbuC family metalloprotein